MSYFNRNKRKKSKRRKKKKKKKRKREKQTKNIQTSFPLSNILPINRRFDVRNGNVPRIMNQTVSAILPRNVKSILYYRKTNPLQYYLVSVHDTRDFLDKEKKNIPSYLCYERCFSPLFDFFLPTRW